MHWDLRILFFVKLLHVLFASLWLGGSFYYNVIVAPVIARSPDMVRRELSQRLTPRVLKVANMIGGMTVLTGLLYLYALADSFSATGRWAELVWAGFLAALGVILLLNYSIRPATKALAELQAKDRPDTPPSQHMLLLVRKIQFSGRASLLLLLGAFAAMVWANVGY